MADRVVHSFVDGAFVYFVWDSGWLVGFNTENRTWEKLEVMHPNQIPATVAPDYALAPEVHADD